MDFTPKQIEVLEHESSPERTLLAVGATGTGKTLAVAFSFAIWLAQRQYTTRCLLTGWTLSSVESNLVRPVSDVLTSLDAKMNMARTYGRELTVEVGGYRHELHILGAKDAQARPRVQGASFAAIVCDEASNFPEEYFDMLWTRMRGFPDLKLWMSANPRHSTHWMKLRVVDHIDRFDGRIVKFGMEDKVWETDSDRELMAKGLEGKADYRRLMLGEWTSDQGAIFPDPPVEKPPPMDQAMQTICGVDWAGSGTFASVLLARFDNVWYVVSERIYHHSSQGALHDEEQVKRTWRWISDQTGHTTPVLGDPTTPAAAKRLFRQRNTWWRDADNSVRAGISALENGFSGGRLKISPDCSFLLNELSQYVWDDKASARGESKPLKRADHAVDAMRYAFTGVASQRRRRRATMSW